MITSMVGGPDTSLCKVLVVVGLHIMNIEEVRDTGDRVMERRQEGDITMGCGEDRGENRVEGGWLVEGDIRRQDRVSLWVGNSRYIGVEEKIEIKVLEV